MDQFLAKVKPDQLPDILLLLVWQAGSEPSAAQAALALLEYDRTDLHVLHVKPQPASGSGSNGSSLDGSGSNGNQGGSAGAPGSRNSSRGTLHWYYKWCRVTTKAAQQKQQWRLTQQQALELVEELLTICVTYNLDTLCQAVAALPAAQAVGEFAAVACKAAHALCLQHTLQLYCAMLACRVVFHLSACYLGGPAANAMCVSEFLLVWQAVVRKL